MDWIFKKIGSRDFMDLDMKINICGSFGHISYVGRKAHIMWMLMFNIYRESYVPTTLLDIGYPKTIRTETRVKHSIMETKHVMQAPRREWKLTEATEKAWIENSYICCYIWVRLAEDYLVLNGIWILSTTPLSGPLQMQQDFYGDV